jgi:hypothetical protein
MYVLKTSSKCFTEPPLLSEGCSIRVASNIRTAPQPRPVGWPPRIFTVLVITTDGDQSAESSEKSRKLGGGREGEGGPGKARNSLLLEPGGPSGSSALSLLRSALRCAAPPLPPPILHSLPLPFLLHSSDGATRRLTQETHSLLALFYKFEFR